MKKKKILIDATGGREWIGGLYYKKNVLFALLQNDSFNSKYSISLVTEPENLKFFSSFSDKIEINPIYYENQRSKKLKLLFHGLTKGCRYIFPYWGKKFFGYFGLTEIYWIADFQECHFPQFFSDELIRARKSVAEKIVKKQLPLILSSNDSYNDLSRYFGSNENVSIMPFVSYIEDEIALITPNYEEIVLDKYNLKEYKYFCVCNQFWQHKNHIVILRAVEIMVQNGEKNMIPVVFTGELKDYRNLSYYEKLVKILDNPEIKKWCKFLGFIERSEQIVLIKNSACVIQPSVFEGWGTVLEDAKVLDKTVILSDISLHQEQKYEKCIMFDPRNALELCDAMKYVIENRRADDFQKGLSSMYESANKYANEFVLLLDKN